MKRPHRHHGGRRRRWPVRTTVVVVVVAGLLASLGVPILVASGRPAVPPAALVGVWTPPLPHVGADFATLRTTPRGDDRGVWLLHRDAIPLRFGVEAGVLELIDREVLARAVEAWNGVPGSRFRAEVAEIVDGALGAPRRDGVSRIHLDEAVCARRLTGYAYAHPDAVLDRFGRRAVLVREVDIGICPTTRHGHPVLRDVIAHEVGHAAGLAHICDPGAGCWDEAMGQGGQRCRIMNPAIRLCTALQAGDRDAIVHLYPAAPRLGGPSAHETAAWVAAMTHTRARELPRVVLADPQEPPELLHAAAALAVHRGSPLLLTGGRCIGGAADAELARLAADRAVLEVVGERALPCARDLASVRTLELQPLLSIEEVAARRFREGATAVVLLVDDGDAEQEPLLAAAAALAADDDAVLMVVGRDGPTPIQRVLVRTAPLLRRVTVVGPSPLAVDGWIASVRPEVSVERLAAGDPVAAVARRTTAPDGPVVVVPAGTAEAAVGVVAAQHLRGELLPAAEWPLPREQRWLLAGARQAVVVAGPHLISAEQQRWLSRALDVTPGGLRRAAR